MGPPPGAEPLIKPPAPPQATPLQTPSQAVPQLAPPTNPNLAGGQPSELPTGATTTEAGTAGDATVKSDIKGPLTEEEKVYLNVQDADIKDVIKQISKATGRNFIIDDKIKGKVTIISERPMTREEAYQTFLSALEVAGYTTVKGPANIIKIVTLGDAKKNPIPTHFDTTPYTDSFITRLIPLENISAVDMSNAIKDLISKDGNMFAYTATNTIIITDSGSNIDRIMKIIRELDQEGPQNVMEIIPVKNAMASDIAKMVQDLFLQEKSKSGGASAAGAKKGAAPQQELAEVQQIIPDERTNSIIVLASKRAIENVKEIIHRLDMNLRADDEGRIHVYYVKHAKAKLLAETLNALTSGAGTAAKGAATPAAAGGSVAKFEGGVKISADETTNALIITALSKDFHTLVDKVISKLDIPRRQIYFEAVIMEMTLSKGVSYGVSGYGGAGGGSVIGFGQTMGSPSLLGSIIGGAATKGTAAWPSLLGGLISSKTTNINYVGPDGKSNTLTVPAFSAFLTALASRGEANVVSTPNILTLDNQEATMTVLTKEPTPGSTTFGAQGIATAQSVDYKEAGLELKIKPQITEGDMVLMEIEQKLSDFTTPKYSSNLNAPAMKERKIKTTVVTENEQTVVLAGLMEDAAQRSKQKVPVLGDIPVLGVLFSTTTTQSAKGNLLIFITPYVIKDRTDFAAILKKKIEERNKFIDSNFSKSRRNEIRNTIKTHREDLLEFSQPMPLETNNLPVDKNGKILTIKRGEPMPIGYQAIEPINQKPPVVTVPSQSTSSRGNTLPMMSQPIESSAWKPVAPPSQPIQPAPKQVSPPIMEKNIEAPVPAPEQVKPVAPSSTSMKSLPPEVEPVKPLKAASLPAPEPSPAKKAVEPKPIVEKTLEPSASKSPQWISPQPKVEPKVEPKAAPVIEEPKTYKKPMVPTDAFSKPEPSASKAPVPATKSIPAKSSPAIVPPVEESVTPKKVKKPQQGIDPLPDETTSKTGPAQTSSVSKATSPTKEKPPAPVITVPKEEASKSKEYKRPTPGGLGDIGSEY